MRNLKYASLLIGIFMCAAPANAQIWKRLKRKVEQKVEQKIEREVDKEIDKSLERNQTEKRENEDFTEEEKFSSKGTATLVHGKKYGTYKNEKLDNCIVYRSNEEVRISGNWQSHAADIFDGYNLVVTGGNALFSNNDFKKQPVQLKIPDQARLTLGYDPAWKAASPASGNFSRAVTEDYQNYDLQSGTVTVSFNGDSLILDFKGTAQLVTRTKNSSTNSDKEYIEKLVNSTISGSVNVNSFRYQDNRTLTKKGSNKSVTQNSSYGNSGRTNNISESSPASSYHFTHKTDMKTTTDKGETYNISYYLNPEARYLGMMVSMDQFEGGVNGSSIIVMDGNDSHVFIETDGMKMRMSQGMMGNQTENPSDQMANFDYTNLTKTGKTKNILGYRCEQYLMKDRDTSIILWVAPDLDLPNYFIQNPHVVDGYALGYEVESREGNMKVETTAISDQINVTINPSDYKKMF